MDEQASSQALSACCTLAQQVATRAQVSGATELMAAPRHALALIEVILATYHRHARFLGKSGEVGVETFGPQFLSLLHQLADEGQHPPRGSHYAMWTCSALEEPVLYTAHRDERHFALLTQHTDALMKDIAEHGLDIVRSEADLADPSTAEIMLELGSKLDRLREDYLLFRSYVTPPEHDYQDRWFLHFRQFLAPIKIADRLVSGPNPANVASWPEVDILFGLSTPPYVTAVKSRYSAYLPEDIFRIERALGTPTVPSFISKTFDARPELSVDQRRRVAAAFASLAKQLKALSGMHWSAIVKHLVKAMPLESEDGREAAILSAGAGVSGRDLSVTSDLLDIRRSENEANIFVKRHQVDMRRPT